MAIRSRLTGAGLAPLQAQNLTGNVNSALTATGASSQAAALLITEEMNVFSTVPSNSGAILRSDLGPGDEQEVANYGSNSLTVYPPVGGTIQNGSLNAGFSVAANKVARFRCINGLNFTAVLST